MILHSLFVANDSYPLSSEPTLSDSADVLSSSYRTFPCYPAPAIAWIHWLEYGMVDIVHALGSHTDGMNDGTVVAHR